MLDLLSQGARTVEALARESGQSVAATSHHLQVLRRTRLVDAEKSGLYVTYRLADAQVGTFVLDLRHLAESRLAEIQRITHQFLGARGALEPVDNTELVRRVRGGEVTLIDVRPREEYVVAYCRGPYCVMALDAVDLLRRKGFRAHRLGHGVAEWHALGWRVEAGDDRHVTRSTANLHRPE